MMRFSPKLAVFLGILVLMLPQGVRADGVSELKRFLSSTRTLLAEFEQVVTGRGERQERARGTLELLRPGKFRWIYQQPYEQTIVGDGERLWLYDRELNQVVVRRLGEALGASPAALLAGDNTFERDYVLKNLGLAEGLEWLEATPKNTEAGFRVFRMGFRDGYLLAMVLTDNFGQTTTLKFSEIIRNRTLKHDRFKFTPPPNAEVIQE